MDSTRNRSRDRAGRSNGPNGSGGSRASGGPGGRSRGGPTLLKVLDKQSDHPCFQCAKCCQYVALEIDDPRSIEQIDHVVWYLYHQGVSVFVDWEGDWYLRFESRCENLTPQGLCAIYERRPAICKDFDWRECENHLTPEDGPADKWLFETADEFTTWFRKQRPKTWDRYQLYLRRKHAGDEEPELQRVSPTRPRPGGGAS